MTDGADDPTEAERSGETDEALAKTKVAVLKFLRDERPKEIFYLGQLEVMFEDRRFLKTEWGMRGPFHWITAKALAQLAAEGRITSDRDPDESPGLNPMRFFRGVQRGGRRNKRVEWAEMDEHKREP